MPEGAKSAAGTSPSDEALEALADCLHAPPYHARRLSEEVLTGKYPRRHPVAGWRLSVQLGEQSIDMDVLAGPDFPWQPPRVALAGPSRFLQWPHVEHDNVLCLLPLHASTDPTRPLEVLKVILGRAVEIVQSSLDGSNVDQFRDEFMSYWSWSRPEGEPHKDVYTLCEIRPPSRLLTAWHGKGVYVVADDPTVLQAWLKNRLGAAVEDSVLGTGALLWVERPWIPSEYPKTAGEVQALLRQHAPHLLTDFVATAARTPIVFPLVIGSPTQAGTGQIALTFGSTVFPKIPHRPRGGPLRGFRPGRIPAGVLAQRNLGVTSLERNCAVRADAKWVHGRDRDTRLQKLRGSHVVVIGCGSLGAPVALKLAAAGVGRLTLIDPEVLSVPNVGRHPLGIPDVGRSKASALAARIQLSYPHIGQVATQVAFWQDVHRTSPDLLQVADLIISTTGDWAAEAALNAWHLSVGRCPSILYGWTEAHAAAGHSVLIGSDSGCLACGFSSNGLPHLAVTSSGDDGMLQQEPACGTTFQMYGPVELTHIEALIAEHAMDALLIDERQHHHRIWAGRRPPGITDIPWSEAWLALMGPNPQAGRLHEMEWPRNSQCGFCGK